jgi:methylated-DNA-[protein]-cysteine S-methyltransferase
MNGIYNTVFNSPIGKINIKSSINVITSIQFIDKKEKLTDTEPSDLTELCKVQLEEYFNGIRREFDIPIQASGTNFQLNVWRLVKEIPFGMTTTYLNISKKMGDSKKTRAIGSANGSNPISILIPCHRIIGKNGKLIGYSGGIWRKQWLLEHENKFSYRQLKLFSN